MVSTPIRDVKRHYERIAGVRIAGTGDQFVEGCEAQLALVQGASDDWLAEVDLLLSDMSWDITQARMAGLISQVLGQEISREAPALLVAAE